MPAEPKTAAAPKPKVAPPPAKPAPFVAKATLGVHEKPPAVVKLPREARVTWGVNIEEPSGKAHVADTIHENVVTSVVVDFQDGVGAPAGTAVELRRAVGELGQAPAYDLAEAAKELKAAKTIEDVAVLFTRVLAAGAAE